MSIDDSTAAGVTHTGGPGLHAEVPLFALVLCQSRLEPHRVGELAFCDPLQERYVGRGGVDLGRFLMFAKHRPGEPLPAPSLAGCIAGTRISREQIKVRATAGGLEIENVGTCKMLVNGVETQRALLKPRDTVVLVGEVVLLCVQRARTLPGADLVLHPFGGPDASGIVGESPAAWALRVELATVGAMMENVLILGESGTGKDMAALALHRASARAKHRLVECSSPSLTKELLDLRLFGAAANFPNPGTPAQLGVIGEADRGTLFLDEIGELSRDAQAALLRFMQTGTFMRMGVAGQRQADVRIFGATNQDLSEAFRGDFGFRFPHCITIPPLDERPEDIPLLLRHLLRQMAVTYPWMQRFFQKGADGEWQPRFSGGMVDTFVRHPLPGNVRELGAMLFAAVRTSVGEEVRLPTSNPTPPPASVPPPSEKDERGGRPSKAEFVAAYAQENGNVKALGRRYAVQRGVIYRWMEVYGVKKKGES